MSVAVLLYAALYQAVSLFANKVATDIYYNTNYVYNVILQTLNVIKNWAEVENGQKP